MSKDGKFVLANCSDSNPVINLWSISQNKIVQQYTGHKQSKYVLKCAFGGKFENYVVCGSEDDMIYIWNRATGELLDRLKGHNATVNNIAWNKQIPNFFFSCSDDQTIIVWGVDESYEVKVHIDSKFKASKDDDDNSDNAGVNNEIENLDSESLGDSSMSEGSIFSDEQDINV